ncbi:EipA family protein [Sphingomonas sp. RT2P30]|uniref:DUF1134 domain-containing protein n=1 Tax=Parasphingomonas halimpatiens TaxID=3096162 RepID=UPI002FC6B6F3
MRKALTLLAAALALGLAGPGVAQVRTIDPNQAIDNDINRPQTAPATPAPSYPAQPEQSSAPQPDPGQPLSSQPPADQVAPGAPGDAPTARSEANREAATATTFKREEILSAAEGTFGKGAAGLAGILERTLKDQGEPNAYIAGREAGGAIVLGLRYGSGTMYHKVEGPMPVHWTGPSVGFDLGGDASKVFVLVYNLYDSEELFRRFPSGEGRLYVVGGFAATYLRRGNIVLIPIRLGVGWRQGVNLGYMKFSHKGKVLPF